MGVLTRTTHIDLVIFVGELDVEGRVDIRATGHGNHGAVEVGEVE